MTARGTGAAAVLVTAGLVVLTHGHQTVSGPDAFHVGARRSRHGERGHQMAAGDNEAMAGGFALAAVPDLSCVDIPATPDQLLPLRHRLATWAAAAGMTTDQIDELILAGDEATSNVVCHAYPDGGGTFSLLASYRPDLGTVHVTIRDGGRWRPEPADPGPLHGRGLVLIRALTQHVTFDRSEEGTTVHMTWLLPGTDSPQG